MTTTMNDCERSDSELLVSLLKRFADFHATINVLEQIPLMGPRIRHRPAVPGPGTEVASLSDRLLVAEPLAIHGLRNGNTLVLQPSTGAWVLLRPDAISHFNALLRVIQCVTREDQLAIRRAPVVQRLLRCGILRTTQPRAHAATDDGFRPLKLLLVKLTAHCNLACRYCYEGQDINRLHRMNLHFARRAIAEALGCARQSLYLCFHGGEPLLRFPEMCDLTVFAAEEAARVGKEICFNVATNGTKFNGQVVRFLLAHRFTIGLSLDGPPDLNDTVRVDRFGRGCHAKIVAALAKYPTLLDRMGMMSTITRLNARRLVQVAEHALRLGLSDWKTTLFYPEGRGASCSADLLPTPEDLLDGHRELVRAVTDGRFKNLAVVPVLIYLNNILSNTRISGCRRPAQCMAANELLVVTVDGELHGCDCRPGPFLYLGNLDTTSLQQVRSQPRSVGLRSTLKPLPSACAACDYRAFCGGPCRGRSLGAPVVNELECTVSRTIIDEIFESLSTSDSLLNYAGRYARGRSEII